MTIFTLIFFSSHHLSNCRPIYTCRPIVIVGLAIEDVVVKRKKEAEENLKLM